SWAAGRANAATITLDALSPTETKTLISRLLDVDDLPEELRARVVQRSEGNPLFCEEFLRMLIDEGRVERVDDRWRATATAADVRGWFARQLERAVGDRSGEFAEIVGYHIERAFALSTEVRAPRAVLEPRARAALDRALALGERARRRWDVGLIRPYASTAR